MEDSNKDKSKAIGGLARAKALTPEQRKDIAKKAAVARWGSAPLLATHKGSFKEDFGIDVDCYVLNDTVKTAVISKRGMGAALGLGEGGSSLQRFTNGKIISGILGGELLNKIDNPLIFNASTPGAESAYLTVHGYDVTMLIDICKSIVKGYEGGKLLSSQANIAKQAQIILNASAKAGIQGLVYKLTGYDATKEETIAAFKLFLLEEAREYEKEFPPQLYNEWYKLYELPKFGRGRPWEFKSLTLNHVYYPLAKSNGKLLELMRASKAKGGDRTKKLHQFLSEIGARALRIHLGRILEMTESSSSKEEYEKKIRDRFGDQKEFEF